MSSIVLSVKDARGEPLEASVEMVMGSTGLRWTAAFWADGCLAHVVSGEAKRCADISRLLQELIIFSDIRAPTGLVS